MSEVKTKTKTNTKSNLSLEVGKYYQDATNRIYYITQVREEDGNTYYCSSDSFYWYVNGHHAGFTHPSQFDLINEVKIKVVTNNNNTGDQTNKEISVNTRTPVNLEVGKYYRDRKGRLWYISEFDENAVSGQRYRSRNYSWLKSGWYFKEGEFCDHDLIEEVIFYI